MPMINCPTCSASLKVPDGMAGRKARCNKCQNIFVIPASSAAVSAVPPQHAPMPQRQAVPQHAAPPPPPPMPAHAYQQGPPQYNPAAGSGIAPSPRGQRPVDPFADNAPPPRRRRKKGGFPVLLVSLIGGGVVLLGLIILLVFLFWPSSGSTADMVYMPDNSEMIASVQVRNLLASGAWQTLAKDFPEMESKLKDMKAEVGIDKDDINSLMVGGQMKGGGQPVVAIRTGQSYTADKILENMNQKGNASTSSAGSHTIHKVNNFGDKAFCVINSNLVLYGPENTLQAVLKRNGQPNLSSSMKSAISSASFGSTIAFALDASAAQNQPMIPGMNFSMPEYGCADINFGSTISVRGSAYFKDGKMADDAKKLIDAGLTTVKLQPLPAKVKVLLDSVNISASGTQLSASVSVDPASIKDMATGLPGGGGLNPLQGLLGGMGGGPGGPINPGGGGFNPPPPVIPGGTIKIPHTDFFTMRKKTVKTYRVFCDLGKPVNLNIKPQFDIKATVTVTRNGAPVAQDMNDGIRQNILVSWTPNVSGVYDVTINHIDDVDNKCTISFTGGGGSKTIFNRNGNIVVNGGQDQHFINLQAGSVYVIRMNSNQLDSFLELYAPNGLKVAFDDDGGGFPNAQILFTATQTGNHRLVCKTFNNQGKGNYTVTVQQQ